MYRNHDIRGVIAFPSHDQFSDWRDKYKFTLSHAGHSTLNAKISSVIIKVRPQVMNPAMFWWYYARREKLTDLPTIFAPMTLAFYKLILFLPPPPKKNSFV